MERLTLENVMRNEVKNKQNINTRIYTTYAVDSDITFIMKQTSKDSIIRSEEVIGFYWGEPNEKDTQEYIGKLKATFND